jgi:predicted MFS family arabinose efflux permease
VRIGVIVTFLLVTGHFVPFTFVRPVLRDFGGFRQQRDQRCAGLRRGRGRRQLAAGAYPRRTLQVIASAITTVLVLIAVLDGVRTGAVVLLARGIAYGGVSVSLQTWMLPAAPRATGAAASLFVAMFNLSIALGAVLGGLMLGAGTTAVLWTGAAVVLIAALAVATARRAAPA